MKFTVLHFSETYLSLGYSVLPQETAFILSRSCLGDVVWTQSRLDESQALDPGQT